MQVRQRLAHGEGHLVQVQHAFEHDRNDVGGAGRSSRAGFNHLGQPVAVVVMQLRHARVQPAKRLAVRRQHQRVGRQRHEFVDGLKKQRQCVGFRLQVIDADIGGNARQHHVAADQNSV